MSGEYSYIKMEKLLMLAIWNSDRSNEFTVSSNGQWVPELSHFTTRRAYVPHLRVVLGCVRNCWSWLYSTHTLHVTHLNDMFNVWCGVSIISIWEALGWVRIYFPMLCRLNTHSYTITHCLTHSISMSGAYVAFRQIFLLLNTNSLRKLHLSTQRPQLYLLMS